ncbi:putative bifunctional diguanylate cyclase/phosphodiesterase [Croceibacterium xixiisoli]|nr:GGDEF domain-containing protein [Croceibacterium xixiisoli]
MLQLDNIILEMIAKGHTLAHTAARLCIEVERLVDGAICSVLTVDQAGILHPLAGPSLPDSYSAALDGLPIGPHTGSCGAAAYLRTDVAAHDIETDVRWEKYKHLALPIGLRACWSSPILDAQNAPIGTFAFYYREHRGPTALEQEIVQHCVYLLIIAIDRHQRVAEHERRAFTDALTGLPNRAAFNIALASLDCEVPGSWALFVVDLDNLKVTNDTFGHYAGDGLLKVAGERILAAASPERMFRVGGDEFAIIIQSPEALHDLEGMADRILTAMLTPADCGGHVIVPRATIGGAVLGAGERVPERVRQNADFALYHAKETGRGGFVRYWPGLGTRITQRLTAIRDVDAALREDRIDGYYQPIVRLDTREIVGLEALCRMRIGREIISASSFHEATTDVHVAAALTERMVELVAADVRAWLDMGIPFQHVGINVSSADMHSCTFHDVLVGAFERQNVPLKHVILEVTESVYMGDGNRAVQKSIEALRTKGLRVALDDFGTGYASLTHLRTVPVDIIKIDKSFVDGLGPNEADRAIVEGLIGIAGKLDIRVVAEGIETEEQARHLQDFGCQLGQGYLFSRAVDRHATTALLMGRAQPLEMCLPKG